MTHEYIGAITPHLGYDVASIVISYRNPYEDALRALVQARKCAHRTKHPWIAYDIRPVSDSENEIENEIEMISVTVMGRRSVSSHDYAGLCRWIMDPASDRGRLGQYQTELADRIQIAIDKGASCVKSDPDAEYVIDRNNENSPPACAIL
jgi:hypothetical protein